MTFLAEKYIGLISARLDQFKRVESGLYNFRCPDTSPFCGDSDKSKYKARGYLYSRNGSYRYHCHNCCIDLSFYKFLKLLDPDLARQYSFEKHGSTISSKPNIPLPTTRKVEQPKLGEYGLLEKLMDRLDMLPESNPAVQYAKDRLIPKDKWKYLYYLDDTSKIVQLSPKHQDRIRGTEARLVIPAFDRNGFLMALTARALVSTENQKKYLALNLSDDQIIYGLDRCNINKTVYVVEGPLDSLFLDNAIAVGTSSLWKAQKFIDKSRDILVPDNQPRNREIVNIVHKCLKNGFRVVIWPPTIQEKDINDMVLAGRKNLEKTINENAFSGLPGLAKFSAWRKV